MPSNANKDKHSNPMEHSSPITSKRNDKKHRNLGSTTHSDIEMKPVSSPSTEENSGNGESEYTCDDTIVSSSEEKCHSDPTTESTTQPESEEEQRVDSYEEDTQQSTTSTQNSRVQFDVPVVDPVGEMGIHHSQSANSLRSSEDLPRPSTDSISKTSIDALLPRSLSREILAFQRRQYHERLKVKQRYFPGHDLYFDLKRRASCYLSDWKEGIHPQTVPTILVLFFMSLAPAISIGGLLETRTDGAFGVTEVLLTTAIASVLWPLIAGQPMLIVGVTGPVAVFVVTVQNLSNMLGFPFVPWLGCVGITCALLHFLFSLFNVIRFVKYVSRFTSEVFAALTGAIFLYQSGEELFALFKRAHDEPDVLLLSLLVIFGTFWCATYFEKADNWTIFPQLLNKAISAAAVPIAIVVFSAITFIPPFNDVQINRLSVPLTFHTTNGRPWVQLSGLSVGAVFGSVVPAFMLLCLFLFDHNVSSVLTQRREFKLRKGSAYHWDYFVVGIILAICGVFSLPFANALIPQSPLHVRQMATFKEITQSTEDGQTVRKQVIDRVRETRITGLFQGLLITVVMLWGQRLLRLIPKGVVVGMFLYFGVTSFYDNEYTTRLKLLITNPSYHRLYAAESYMQGGVPFSTVVWFTLLQTVLFSALVAITLSPISLLFPLCILLFLPFRIYVMPYIFSEVSLERLDSEIMPDEEECGIPDPVQDEESNVETDYSARQEVSFDL